MFPVRVWPDSSSYSCHDHARTQTSRSPMQVTARGGLKGVMISLRCLKDVLLQSRATHTNFLAGQDIHAGVFCCRLMMMMMMMMQGSMRLTGFPAGQDIHEGCLSCPAGPHQSRKHPRPESPCDALHQHLILGQPSSTSTDKISSGH